MSHDMSRLPVPIGSGGGGRGCGRGAAGGRVEGGPAGGEVRGGTRGATGSHRVHTQGQYSMYYACTVVRIHALGIYCQWLHTCIRAHTMQR